MHDKCAFLSCAKVFPLLSLTCEVRLLQVRITRQDERLDLWQAIQCIVGETQMIFDNLLRCQAQPLSDRDIIVRWCL